jgi:hypothetical protein
MCKHSGCAAMRPFVSVVLCLLISVTGDSVFAQQRTAPAKLNIVVVAGEAAVNDIRQRKAQEPIVQVEDENHQPLAGVAVLFSLPNSGPGGLFSNGTRTLQVVTNSRGRAFAEGLRANEVQGKFQIQVEASYEGVTSSTAINQVNSVITSGSGGGVSGKMIAILAIAGGAAAGGVIAATRKGNNAPASGSTAPPVQSPITITAGAPSVGGPQ